MAGLEADQDVAIAGADRAGIDIDEIYEALRQADIVDDGIQVTRRNHFADVIFDLSESLQRILDAGTGRQSGVQFHLPGIYRGEEVGTQERHQQERYRDKASARRLR
jgi:hypothetical protein